MPIQSLPVELLDQCLCYLRRDYRPGIHHSASYADLKSCSLVCREWRNLSQPHLFHQVGYLYNAEDGDPTPYDTIDTGDVPSFTDNYRTLQLLSAFLHSRPYLASCIRILSLDSNDIWMAEEANSISYNPVDPFLFSSLLAALTGLQELRLTDVTLEAGPTDDGQQARPSLQTLTLRYDLEYGCVSALDLRNLLAHFSCIGKLALENPDSRLWIDPLEGAHEVTSPRVEVQHISVNMLEGRPSVAAFADMLACTIQIDKVRRLHLIDGYPATYQRLVDVVGSGLEELYFEVESVPLGFDQSEIPNAGLRIITCTQLQTLSLSISVHGVGIDVVKTWDIHARNLCDFIRQANISSSTYPHLRHFVVALAVGCSSYQKQPQPELVRPLDEALAALVRRTAVTSVTFAWAPSVQVKGWETLEGSEFAAYVHATFPILRESGMISVKACADDYPGYV